MRTKTVVAERAPCPPGSVAIIEADQPGLRQSLGAMAVMMSCHRGQEICGQNRRADHWYCVVAGVARRCVVRADGRRQIVDLLLPGDFFGFSATDEYGFTVEAISDGTIVANYPRQRVELLADADPRIARQLRQVAFDALSRLQAQILIVGRITALEKVGSFILEMGERMSGPAGVVMLPVSRYDIADYLAVSVETVSRSLTDLQQRGVIRLFGTRHIQIVNRAALAGGRAGAPH